MRILILLFGMLLASCGESKIVVTVENPLDFERENETVAIALSDLQPLLKGVEVEDYVVMHSGEQIPSQLSGDVLLFQASVGARSTERYIIVEGLRDSYLRCADGRLVPERMDDWAWENNKMAFRVYGPALEATGEVSNGIDVWAKRTNELIIDKWYAQGDYHTDHGEGVDFYKVGRTLGAGAMAPMWQDTLQLGRNFVRAELLDSGAIRTTVRLTYAPYMAAGVEVAEQRIISLDANSNFNTVTEIYEGAFDSMEVAAGIILRDGGQTKIYPQAAVYTEPQVAQNGTLHLAVIMPKTCAVDTVQNHIAARSFVRASKPYTYFNGAGWSKAEHPDAQSWQQTVEQQIAKIKNPLKVNINEEI